MINVHPHANVRKPLVVIDATLGGDVPRSLAGVGNLPGDCGGSNSGFSFWSHPGEFG
jgi:hypothetical protein